MLLRAALGPTIFRWDGWAKQGVGRLGVGFICIFGVGWLFGWFFWELLGWWFGWLWNCGPFPRNRSNIFQDASLPFITCSQNGMSLADMWIVSPDNKVRWFWSEKGFPMTQKHGRHTVRWCKISVQIVTEDESWQASFGTCSSAIRPLGSRESRNSLVCSLHLPTQSSFFLFPWLH